jgi:hypothetical protein
MYVALVTPRAECPSSPAIVSSENPRSPAILAKVWRSTGASRHRALLKRKCGRGRGQLRRNAPLPSLRERRRVIREAGLRLYLYAVHRGASNHPKLCATLRIREANAVLRRTEPSPLEGQGFHSPKPCQQQKTDRRQAGGVLPPLLWPHEAPSRADGVPRHSASAAAFLPQAVEPLRQDFPRQSSAGRHDREGCATCRPCGSPRQRRPLRPPRPLRAAQTCRRRCRLASLRCREACGPSPSATRGVA